MPCVAEVVNRSFKADCTDLYDQLARFALDALDSLDGRKLENYNFNSVKRI